MIPPGPGHQRPTVAIGCESGVVVYDLETGRRTRVFAGHSSPVVALAPSPDGRWLASSSLDQTIKLYGVPIATEKKTNDLPVSRSREQPSNGDPKTLGKTTRFRELFVIDNRSRCKLSIGPSETVFEKAKRGEQGRRPVRCFFSVAIGTINSHFIR